MWLNLCLLVLSPVATFSMYGIKPECVSNTYPPNNSQVPRYVINLDLSPAERWNEFSKDYKNQTIDVLQHMTDHLFGEPLMNLFNICMPLLLKTLPKSYQDELQGISTVTSIPVGQIVLYNIFYELFAACTSIVVRDDQKDLTILGRNLDYGLFLGFDFPNNTWGMTKALKPTVVQLEFQRSNVTVYQSASFASYIGVLTGMKNGLFSVSVNARGKGGEGYGGLAKWIFGDRTQSFVGFAVRDVLENAGSYAEARQMLETAELLAPAYFILGGNRSDEACVITKDKNSETAVDVWTMANVSTWFLVETNYDHWKAPLFLDDRRNPTTDCLNNKTQKVGATFPGLYDVLNSKPIRNVLSIYTCLMNAKESTMETYFQSCSDNCGFW